MASYNVTRQPVVVDGTPADLFKIGFGDPADNATIVRDAMMAIAAAVDDKGGSLALVSGPASLPAAFVLGHKLAHMFAAIAVFDPKMAAYVVAVAHGAGRSVGDAIPATAVTDAISA